MAKEAYYFSHDSNARQDPKILEMISVYGVEGYGRYWILIEVLREQSDYTIAINSKYAFNAIAMQMHCTRDEAEQYVHDCVHEFGLLSSDGEKVWSDSLKRRMAMREEISEKRRKAAEARWGKNTDKPTGRADEMQMHSTSNANAMQGKERKGKESKKNKYPDSFELFWKEYPRKEDKKAAFGKWKTAVKEDGEEVVLDGAIKYRKECERDKTEKRFIKHASTFLNKGSYMNYRQKEGQTEPNRPRKKTESELKKERLDYLRGELSKGYEWFLDNAISDYWDVLKKEAEEIEQQLRAN